MIDTLLPLLFGSSGPVMGLVYFFLRWRKEISARKSDRDKVAETAAKAVLKEAQDEARRNSQALLDEKDRTIKRLEGMLQQEQRDAERMMREKDEIISRLSGGQSNPGPGATP